MIQAVLLLHWAVLLIPFGLRRLLPYGTFMPGTRLDVMGRSFRLLKVSTRKWLWGIRVTTNLILDDARLEPVGLVMETYPLRLLRGLGLVREFATGDADFDRKIWILSESARVAEVLGTRPELRGDVLKAFRDSGAVQIETNVSGAVCVQVRRELSTADTEFFGKLLLDLSRHFPESSGMPEAAGGRFGSNRVDKKIWDVVAILPTILAYLAVTPLIYLADTTPRLLGGLFLVESLWAATGFIVLIGLWLAKNFGRSPWAPRAWTEGLLKPLIVFPLVGSIFLYEANIVLDFRPATIVQSKIEKVDCITDSNGKISRCAFLPIPQVADIDLSGLMGGGIPVSAALGSAARAGQTYTVVLKPGLLGRPWIESVQLE